MDEKGMDHWGLPLETSKDVQRPQILEQNPGLWETFQGQLFPLLAFIMFILKILRGFLLVFPIFWERLCRCLDVSKRHRASGGLMLG